jgi:long-chain acyl-CoA synthetase
VATDAARADTFPKLLMRNARLYAGRPAYRHKDLGIWQAWTWTQVLDEVRALSAGLSELGLKRDDKIAIVGSNRPRLYWAMCAAQALGAVPVPIYADSVADEMAYIFEHAEVTIAVVEDQEQVDKLLSIADRLPRLARIVYDEPRGLRDYDHQRLKSITDVQKLGRASLAADADGLQRGRRRGGQRSGPRRHALHFRHDRPAQGRDADLRQSDCLGGQRQSVRQARSR